MALILGPVGSKGTGFKIDEAISLHVVIVQGCTIKCLSLTIPNPIHNLHPAARAHTVTRKHSITHAHTYTHTRYMCECFMQQIAAFANR